MFIFILFLLTRNIQDNHMVPGVSISDLNTISTLYYFRVNQILFGKSESVLQKSALGFVICP